MLLSIGADTNCIQFQKEIFILQSLSHMIGTGEAHSLAIAADALFIEHRQVHFAQNEHVLRFHGCVAHHSLIFFLGTAIVTLTIAAVGTKRISVHIYRLVGAFRPGNINDHDMIAFGFLNEYILGRQHTHAGLVGVVDDVPELLDESVRGRQVYRVQRFISLFFHAQ